MPASTPSLPEAELEPCMVLDGVTYGQYQTINDTLVDRHNPRMIYAEGRLQLLTTSRLHDWYNELFAHLVGHVATGCGMEWSPSGQATYRHPALDAGIEGDRVYYIGESAILMAGPVEIDLSTQPPPDLAIEVEHTRSADHALKAWGRIGVPEVWRFHVAKQSVSFWVRQQDGTYLPAQSSNVLPPLRPSDVDEQIRLAERLGSNARWLEQLPHWVRETLLPRLGRIS